MTRRLHHAVTTCAAILLIALTSVVFAAQKAPAAHPATTEAFLAAGGSLDDLCGGSGAEGHEHCPFCRLLPDTPPVRPAPRVFRLAVDTDLSALSALVRTPWGGSPRARPRAPPLPV